MSVGDVEVRALGVCSLHRGGYSTSLMAFYFSYTVGVWRGRLMMLSDAFWL